jgi:hypothetical protein
MTSHERNCHQADLGFERETIAAVRGAHVRRESGTAAFLAASLPKDASVR